jgi:hypothetical protein
MMRWEFYILWADKEWKVEAVTTEYCTEEIARKVIQKEFEGVGKIECIGPLFYHEIKGVDGQWKNIYMMGDGPL